MESPHFFVSRYASTAEHARFVHRAVASVRRALPAARVTVVDDGSAPEFAYEPEPGDALTDVVRNPHPRSGELGALCVAHRTLRSRPDDALAVTMHDTMVLARPVTCADLTRGGDLAFLWSFDMHHAMHLPETLRLVANLDLAVKPMFDFTNALLNGFNRSWNGCFGMALAARRSALDRIDAACGLLSPRFVSAVTTREARQAAERVVGLAAHAFRPAADASAPLLPAVCGGIFDHPACWERDTAALGLDDLLRIPYRGPFVKTWAGR